VTQPLRAPLEIGFDYTRSLGPTLSRFMAALADRRILGSRSADGRVYAPPFEFDPVTFEPPDDLVPVGPEGTVTTWSWAPQPLEGQPLPHPVAWALIRLDGADTAMLHAVDAGSAAAMRTGMRVRPRWAGQRAGDIRDIVCFEPSTGAPEPDEVGTAEKASPMAGQAGQPEPVAMMSAPVRLHYEHTASPEESRFLRGLAEGRLLAQRCPVCGKVYIPPRGACPTDGVPTTDEVELPDHGIVTTFCVVNVDYPGQRVSAPYVAAAVLLDGADIPFQHLILGCDPDEVRMGMRVRAEWKPREEWGTTLENIDHFRPTGEPDAPYQTYAHHL
jgi:uncharacterized OB-fold protein